jgi:hypothetical protein
MEFFGRSHDYFSRVKAADKNKILGKLPVRRAGPPIVEFIELQCGGAWACAIIDQLPMLTSVVACRRRDARGLRKRLCLHVAPSQEQQ